MWEILIMSAAENSNKFQKTRFWNEKSVEDVVTLGSTAHATLIYTKRCKGYIFVPLHYSDVHPLESGDGKVETKFVHWCCK
jgi:hypothetical protein